MQLISDSDRPRQDALSVKGVSHFVIRVPLLHNLIVSYRWRPILSDALLKELGNLHTVDGTTTGNNDDANNINFDSSDSFPQVIVIGKPHFILN